MSLVNGDLRDDEGEDLSNVLGYIELETGVWYDVRIEAPQTRFMTPWEAEVIDKLLKDIFGEPADDG